VGFHFIQADHARQNKIPRVGLKLTDVMPLKRSCLGMPLDEQMIQALRYASAPEKFNDLKILWKTISQTAQSRKRWKRLQQNLRIVPGRRSYECLSWKNSSLIIAPQEVRERVACLLIAWKWRANLAFGGVCCLILGMAWNFERSPWERSTHRHALICTTNHDDGKFYPFVYFPISGGAWGILELTWILTP
jgi:hypothetical protein